MGMSLFTQSFCLPNGGGPSGLFIIHSIILSPEWRRPKRLLVFINPFGGKKRAVKIFREKVQPLFEMAGIYSDVIGRSWSLFFVV